MRPRWLRPSPCHRVSRELHRYLDGESDPDAAWRVARHLSQCEDCFSDADTIRQLKDALAHLRIAPDADALARLHGLLTRLADPATGT